MPRLTRLYTRKGDDGSTKLATGQEVPKDSARVEAFGTVDELNAQLGVAVGMGLAEVLSHRLARIQNELFDLGAGLATPLSAEVDFEVPRIGAAQVKVLEELIDELNEQVGPLENFILPGGSPGACALHVARAICRRAERRLVGLGRSEELEPHALPYLNRLSDALFVMARYENRQRGVAEPLWEPSG